MLELLLLLLPVAAASGWLAARRGQQGGREARGARDPAYFRGLNYLLNEQPDKAIDVFIKLLEVDSETVETHLALGNLFRRRGEVDRAIRIHQNLIARPNLNQEQRALALLELGQDYMRAGLFDRAESLFQELVELGFYRSKALANLKEIYQQEKDWPQCLHVARQLEAVTGQSHQVEIAHYYCEMAEETLQGQDTATAWDLTRQALAVDAGCARATLIQADMERLRHDFGSAIRVYQGLAEQCPEFVSEMLPKLIACYQRLGQPDALTTYLGRLYRDRPGDTRVMLAYADALRATAGEEAVLDMLGKHLQGHVDLAGMERFLELKGQTWAPGDQRQTLELLGRLVHRLVEKQPAYQCTRCGFEARRMHWHCPGCKGWSTVRQVSSDGIDPR